MCTYKKFCCCCCNVVTCAKVFAILGLIAGAIHLVYTLLAALGVGNLAARYIFNLIYSVPSFYDIIQTVGATVFLWGSVVISAIWMIPDALMLLGINKNRPGFMLPWLIMKMIYLVIFTIWSIVAIALLITTIGVYNNDRQSRGTATGLVVMVVILAIFNALGYYIWDIVKSAYKQIKEENRSNQHAYEMSARNTYEQKPPAYYAPA